jgi:hypothetical protein
MATLTSNDSTTISSLQQRVNALRPDTRALWGTMTVDQMLWHVSEALEMALGRKAATSKGKGPVVGGIIRTLVLYGPWPKGKTPTADELKATSSHDFAAQHERLLRLLAEFGTKSAGGSWPTHPGFGAMSGKQWIRLQMRHLDHHLSQFGV